MNFTGNNSIKNNILSGAYAININPIDPYLASFWRNNRINPSGITGIFVYYSQGGENIDSGYYAISSGSQKIYISGASSEGNASGYLYYRISTPIFGVCHGFGNDSGSWISGYNFYNAFHPEGYIAPPFGQQKTIFKQLKEEEVGAALYLNGNGGCGELKREEYNDIFGIISKDKGGNFSFINSPAASCPDNLPRPYYWNEKNYKLIAGTSSDISSNSFFNSNPIPTSLDAFYAKVEFRYAFDKRTSEGQTTNIIQYNQEGKPKPYASIEKYVLFDGYNMCNVPYAENSLSSLSTQTRSQLLDVNDYLSSNSNPGFDDFNWWNTWHFLFKENSDGFPFGMDSSQGTAMFGSTLSDVDYYWENRQCPSVVDFLPHTFGASIYACPSYHFDIPYYAAINKFGFYGTRFFNGCKSLLLEYPSSGYPERGMENAQELPGDGFSYSPSDEGEPDNDTVIFYGDDVYDNLLNISKAEETISDFFALNKIFFLWINFSLVTESPEYEYLTGRYFKFDSLLKEFVGEFEGVFPSGKQDLFKNNKWFQSKPINLFYDTGEANKILLNNDNYKYLKNELIKLLVSGDISYWDQIEKKYATLILNSEGTADTDFYYSFETGKQNRFQTRYFENYINGRPIDLYPSNKITFGFDRAKDYIDSYSWGKRLNFIGNSPSFDDTGINRRYFIGAYGENNDFNSHTALLNQIEEIKNSYFYPGFFHSKFATDFIEGTYLPVIKGNAYYNGEPVDMYTIRNSSNIEGANLIGNGWLALGYNGIGKLKNNYSCFTPIFVQQPLPFVYCKIGQSPTFRSLAVDYHTIPEDKINDRYPEIKYWTKKLKIVDSKERNRYPLSYKWYRIRKQNCGNDFKNFITSGYFSVKFGGDFDHTLNGDSTLEPANTTGSWCCLEGDGPFCTLIHPNECVPQYNENPAFSYRNIGTLNYEEAKRNNYYMTFKKGADIETFADDQYYYFCIVKGRFGMRISEPSELIVDKGLRFDISVQNGGNASVPLQLKFEGSLNNRNIEIQVNGTASPYQGFSNDPFSIPEDVIEMQIPPPNKGWGDVYSYKFVGNWGYAGALQSYTPGTLNDTRGLRETWGRFLHYGALVKFNKILTQEEGDLLYGTNHLPICDSGQMPEGQKGIKLNTNGIVHWANMQSAIVSTDGKRGIRWDKLANAGQLYNPASNYANGVQDTSIRIGLGQWQWGNNLGTIHRFGYRTSNDQLLTEPGRLSDNDKLKLKNKLLKYALGGEECGWTRYGLGRNMLYWIEGFDSFYSFCDPLKKKNVTNYSYMNPGLRYTNSSIQYFWLGKPSNAYLKRYPMIGPYAYQWKMMRHNRDRNGNGISEGFYSYGWETNYSLMYDAPAVYGLFINYNDPPEGIQQKINQINLLRSAVHGTSAPAGVRYTRFGFTNGDGGARPYGTTWLGKKDGSPNESERNKLMRGYMNSGEEFARSPRFQLYGCDDSDLLLGDCFDPCMSIRYSNGILPGGKKQQLTTNKPSGNGYSIVSDNFNSSLETVNVSGKFFRGPFGTPHHKYLREMGINLDGFSPCLDGGADHCNYITPTMNIGASCYLETEVPSLLQSLIEASAGLNVRLNI